jgi:hypothetical protein
MTLRELKLFKTLNEQPLKLPRSKTKGDPAQMAYLDQRQHYLPRCEIMCELNWRGVVPVTEVWIYPEYPTGYTAVFGTADNMVNIYVVEWGVGMFVEKKPCLGVRQNGSLIY